MLGLVFLTYAASKFCCGRVWQHEAQPRYHRGLQGEVRALCVRRVSPIQPVTCQKIRMLAKGLTSDQGYRRDRPKLKDVLLRGGQKLECSTLIELMCLFVPLPTQLEGDAE